MDVDHSTNLRRHQNKELMPDFWISGDFNVLIKRNKQIIIKVEVRDPLPCYIVGKDLTIIQFYRNYQLVVG